MSTGNGAAAIGLSNDNKLAPIGGKVANVIAPTAGAPYLGDVVKTWWNYNVLQEDPTGPFTVPSCNAGFLLYYVTTGSSPVVVNASGRLLYTNGTVTSDAAGDLKTYIPEGTTIPAGCYFWVESYTGGVIEYTSGSPIPDQTTVTVDQPYSLDLKPFFTGGPPPKIFDLFSGSLPPGLSVGSTTGIVSGTPTVLGASGSVVFRGRDGAGNSALSSGVPFEVVSLGDQVILLQGNGTDGTAPIDTSSYAGTITGNAVVNALALKYGSAGIYFTGLNKSLSAPNDARFNVGANDFTIQFWYRRRSNTGDFQAIWSRQSSGAGGTAYGIVIRQDNSGNMQFYCYCGAANSYLAQGTMPAIGTYFHVACVRDGTITRVYINGVQGGTIGAIGTDVVNDPSIGFKMGMRGFDAGHPLDADVDDFEMLTGYCLYPGGTSFTPPGALVPQ